MVVAGVFGIGGFVSPVLWILAGLFALLAGLVIVILAGLALRSRRST